MRVERYSHVMHLVSTVAGEVAPEHDALDVFDATFPAGTVSGAPKPRAMEIIESLEPTRRALYAGTVGYVDAGGDMDMAIAIRTAVLHQGRAYVQAGAGIVADSDPATEEAETRHKARAVLSGDRDGGGRCGSSGDRRRARRAHAPPSLGAVGRGARSPLIAGGQAWAPVTAACRRPLPPVAVVPQPGGRRRRWCRRPGWCCWPPAVALLAVAGRRAGRSSGC